MSSYLNDRTRNDTIRLENEWRRLLIDTLKNLSLSNSGAEWGAITGTLSSQTDLQTALDAKVDENSAISGATKTKITYDSKGLVTAGADIGASDLPTGIDAAKIADGSVSNTEFQYINSLSSNVQTQLDALNVNRYAYLTSQQDVTSASETDVTSIVFSVAANSVYIIEIACATECSGTSGINFGHKIPAGSTLMLSHWGRSGASSTIQNLGNVYTGSTGLINTIFNAVASATGYYIAHMCLKVDATAGNYQLSYASVSGAQTSSIRAYSHAKIIKIA